MCTSKPLINYMFMLLGSWTKVQSALKAYADGEHDFCIDADTIANITCLSDADTNRLVKQLSQNKSGMYGYRIFENFDC